MNASNDGSPDEPRDPHLHAALRNAPDAQMRAPDSLSARILGEARAKARSPGAAAAPTSFIRIGWSRLTQPAVATALTGVLVATIVGLMWWGEPIDQAQAPRPPAVQSSPAQLPAKPPASRSEISPPAKPNPAAAPAPSALDSRKAERKKEAESSSSAEASARAAPSSAAEPTQAPAEAAPESAPAPVEAREESVSIAAPAAAELPASQLPAPMSASKARPAIAAMSDQLAGAARDSRELRELRERRAVAAPMPATPAAAPMLAEVPAQILAAPERWRWHGDAGTSRPMNEPMRAWLAEFDMQTRTRWRAVAEPSAIESAASWQLLLDGQPVLTIRIGERSVLALQNNGSWQAELPAATLEALRASLQAAMR